MDSDLLIIRCVKKNAYYTNMIQDVILGACRSKLFIVVSQTRAFHFVFVGWER